MKKSKETRAQQYVGSRPKRKHQCSIIHLPTDKYFSYYHINCNFQPMVTGSGIIPRKNRIPISCTKKKEGQSSVPESHFLLNGPEVHLSKGLNCETRRRERITVNTYQLHKRFVKVLI